MAKAVKSQKVQQQGKRQRDDFDDELNVPSEVNSPIVLPMPPRDIEMPIVAASEERIDDAEYDPGDFSHDVQKMVEGFGAVFSKRLSNKKKRMEQLAQASLKKSNKKIEEISKVQQQTRKKMQDECNKQLLSVYQQWGLNIEKTKDQEEELKSMIVQSQMLKTVRELCEQCFRGPEELENTLQSQLASLQADLKKGMLVLQKQILLDTQQEELAHLKASLRSRLF